MKKENYVLGLDISTSCIGIALFEDMGDHGKIRLLDHVSPKVKPKPESKIQELFEKANIFKNEFLVKYKDFGITRVIIEEPLLRSNNVNTIATLLRFNGMLSRDVYALLGVVPEFISSYESRRFAFPELMAIRTHNKKGEPYTEKELLKSKNVLFGAYPWDMDKKSVIFQKVSELEPQIIWLYDKNNLPKKENYDASDAYSAVIGFMQREGYWKCKN